MGKRLYVGNLPYPKCNDAALLDLFAPRHPVEIKVVSDRDTGRPRGFCFVEFATDEEAAAVIAEFNGIEIDGRKIVVNEANDKPKSTHGGGRRDYDAGNGGQREREGRGRRGGHGW